MDQEHLHKKLKWIFIVVGSGAVADSNDFVADSDDFDVAIHHPVFCIHCHCNEKLLLSQVLEFC